MKVPKAYNYTPRRSKALPVVEHSDLWLCILISKERDKRVKKWSRERIPWSGSWSLFWWGNEEYKKWRERYQEDSKDALKRELREELWDEFELEKIFDLKESKDAVGEILSDARWRLVWRSSAEKIKQRLFAVKLSWNIGCKWTDNWELTGMGFYPIWKWRKLEKIRKTLEINMDEFAIQALRQNLQKMRSWVFEAWDINVTNLRDLKWFKQDVSKTRGLVSRILGK